MATLVYASSDEVSGADFQRAGARHGFLPIVAAIQVYDQSSTITLTSPSDYDFDVLTRVGPRTFLVKLVPIGTGSAGTVVVPEKLAIPAPLSLQVCLREGDEQ